jgi:hypothetical protein
VYVLKGLNQECSAWVDVTVHHRHTLPVPGKITG